MKAILRTRCGCTREMNIPYPPQPRILLPLSSKTSWFHLEMDAQHMDPARPNMGVREFELLTVHHGDLHFAEYIETKEQRRC